MHRAKGFASEVPCRAQVMLGFLVPAQPDQRRRHRVVRPCEGPLFGVLGLDVDLQGTAVRVEGLFRAADLDQRVADVSQRHGRVRVANTQHPFTQIERPSAILQGRLVLPQLAEPERDVETAKRDVCVVLLAAGELFVQRTERAREGIVPTAVVRLIRHQTPSPGSNRRADRASTSRPAAQPGPAHPVDPPRNGPRSGLRSTPAIVR